MDDLTQNTGKNYTGGNPYETQTPASTAPINSAPAQVEQVVNGLVYAGFWQRFLATLIDGILVNVIGGILALILGFTLGVFGASESASGAGSLLGMFVGISYYVIMTSQKGATLGKQALGLRVQNIETGQNLDVVSAILREVVGKFISCLVLLLGYFWMLWDDKKQTWHDKIAKSVVVKVR